MIPYPENKPTEPGYYAVELFDGSIINAKWNGCGWANFTFNTTVVQFNSQRLGTRSKLYKWDKQTKSLIKIEI